MVRAALHQLDPQLALQPLHLLTQRRLHDVLPCRRTAEMQLFGQRHEITKLAKLHARHFLSHYERTVTIRFFQHVRPVHARLTLRIPPLPPKSSLTLHSGDQRVTRTSGRVPAPRS